MRIVEFETIEGRVRGLIGMNPIPDDTLFVFHDVRPGDVFHSRGVLEPFDISFKSGTGETIASTVVHPPHGTATAPPGTRYAMEAKRGILLT